MSSDDAPIVDLQAALAGADLRSVDALEKALAVARSKRCSVAIVLDDGDLIHTFVLITAHGQARMIAGVAALEHRLVSSW